jgi:type II secretory pathway pseudopilin PulG
MNRQAGMTLAELAIALMVLGLIMGGALELYNRSHAQRQIDLTYENVDAITDTLSVYVNSTGRLPCPADPAADDNALGKERSGCDTTTREGILPFATLNIPRKMAMDGWGRYFTYAVSPVFARKNDQSQGLADNGKVHASCRHPGWVKPDERFNRNGIKARFCCADQLPPVFDVDSDLIVVHTDGQRLSPVRLPGIKENYEDLTKATTTKQGGAEVPALDATPIEAPAFVLVSHGKNGRGAWLGTGTTNRFDPPDSGDEFKNASGEQVFVDGPWNLVPGPNYFDDIVRWMTQDGIMAAHGALSCQYP